MATTQQGNNYPNPLDNFRTYSYHFVLTVAGTTTAFEAMLGKNLSANQTANSAGPVPLLGQIQNAKLGDNFKPGGEDAWLLVDTRRFSQYSITKLEMEHVYGTGNRVNPTVPSNTTKVSLIDTTGMSFFNFLMDVFRNKIQSTRASSFFLLAVIFVGHRDDGTTETISTCYIPLMLLLMGWTFTSKGSEYEIEFMELEGAPHRGAPAQQINYLGTCQSITTSGSSETLGSMVDALERNMNLQSLEFYKKYVNTQAGKKNADGTPLKLGKLVQYMMTIPEEWRAFKVDLAARSKNIEQMYKVTNGKVDESAIKAAVAAETSTVGTSGTSTYKHLTFSPAATITDAIKAILECSTELLKLASEEKRKAGTAQAFKTITSITSDKTSYVIHFDIYPYLLPKLDDSASAANKLNAGSTKKIVGSSDIIKNVMTYDYIYTGHNSHIRDLKIQYLPESAVALDTNLQIGQNRFNVNSAAGQVKQDVSSAKNGATQTSESASMVRPGDPIFLPMRTRDQQNNNADQKTEELTKEQAQDAFKAKQEYTQTYGFIHFLSSINLDVTIRGNPNIIRKYADRNERGGVPPHPSIVSEAEVNTLAGSGEKNAVSFFNSTIAPHVATAKNQYYTNFVKPRIDAVKKNTTGSDALINGVDVATLPVFCKLNLLAPDVDYDGNFFSDRPMFTNQFFFNGFYQVLFVKTTFDNGEFDHVLSMIPYVVNDTVEKNDTSSVAPTKKRV